jgi:hypothetical protein
MNQNKDYYNSKINTLKKKFEKTELKIIKNKEKLDQIPVPYHQVEKPIQRFFLYGGEPAKKFLIQSIHLINRTLAEEKIPSHEEIGLPERVTERFYEWWKEYKKQVKLGDTTEIRKFPDSEEKYRTPTLYLDTAISEMKVHFPSQLFQIPDNIFEIDLIINENSSDSYKKQLRLYQYNENLIETEDIDFPLPFPSDYYEFTLKNGNQKIYSWNLPGLDINQPFLAFKDNSKTLIREIELPQGKVWFVLHKNHRIIHKILEETYLYGKWRDYKCIELEINNEQIELLNESGEKTYITVSSSKNLEIKLFGNQPLKGCKSHEEDIFIKNSPDIIIPLKFKNELKGWIISVIPDRNSTLPDSKHYQLIELKDILINHNNEIKIPLSSNKLLGENPFGRFTLRLKNDIKHIDQWFKFCILPQLKKKFDKQIYLPSEEGALPVYLTLDGLEGIEFEQWHPAISIVHKNNFYRIKTSSSEQSIHGMLKYSLSHSKLIYIPITFSIPRLTWRLIDFPNDEYSNEINKIEEIWFGDMQEAGETLSLIISMPAFLHGKGILYLRDSEKNSMREIKEGKIKFNLLDFSTTLRAAKGSLQFFDFTVPDSESLINNVELFNIRTKWKVVGLECIQKFNEGTLILTISWKKEKGQPNGSRIMSLWRISETTDTNPVIRKKIPERAYSITVTEEYSKLPPGTYRIQIDSEDPWSTTEPVIPHQDSLNTKDIQIQKHKELLYGEINIISVIDDIGHAYNLYEKYYIHIEGKIISGQFSEIDSDLDENIFIKPETNEGWYVGNISYTHKGSREREKIKNVNPVKFDYKPHKDWIESIEDINGEGIYFCKECQRLFWYEKGHERDHKEYILSEKLKFKIKFV